MNKKIFFQKF